MDSPLKYFADLRDPRVERRREHLLEEILSIAIAAVLSGANGWNEIEDYAQSKGEWFKSFLRLPGGIPSHDTLNRVFSALDPEELEKGFVAWVWSIAKLTEGEVVAIDGKALRGTQESGGKRPSCIWFRRGQTATTWCWVSAEWMKNPMRSRRFPSCSRVGVERNGGDHRRHGLPASHRRKDRRQKGRLYFGGQRKPGPSAGRDQGFLSDAGYPDFPHSQWFSVKGGIFRSVTHWFYCNGIAETS